jgi:site-specific DNA-adenine methylase
MPEFPVEMDNYVEPFGRRGVSCFLFTYVKEGIIKVRAYAYDLNEPLIHVYKNIQTSHVELYDAVQTVVAELGSCGNGDVNRKPATIEEAITSRNYYYWTRVCITPCRRSNKRRCMARRCLFS